MSTLHFVTIRALIAGLAIACGTQSGRADGAGFPDDWFFSGAQRPQPLRALEGQPAPELVTQAWIGDPVSLKDARGKVVVLDFWATWCGPCMAAIPENIALVDKHKDQGLVFIGVHDANSGWDKAAGVVQSKGINYPVAHDKGDSAKNVALQFWPTYVVIDRMGVIRGAGLLPGKVKEAVEMLLAEAGPADDGAFGGPPPEWYFGGQSRPAWLRRLEGKPAPPIEGTQWYGTPLADADRPGKIVVVQFLSPGSELAMTHLAAMAEIEKELGSQGVAFLGICDARVPWEKASEIFQKREIAIPIVQDAKGLAKGVGTPAGAVPSAGAPSGVVVPALPPGARVATPVAAPAIVTASVPAVPATTRVRTAGSAIDAAMATALQEIAEAEAALNATTGAAPGMPSARALMSMGATADAMGLRIAPITVVIDRSGVVCAAGVRPDKLKDVLTVLLAEPTPSVLPAPAPPATPAPPVK